MKFKKKSLILMFLFLLALLPLISSNTYTQNSDVDIQVSCLNIDCNTSTQITIVYPNTTIAVNNATMTTQDAFVNYTFNQTDVLGKYNYYLKSIGGTPEYYSDSFDITSTGDTFTTAGAIVLWLAVSLFILFAFILFNGFTKKENKIPVRLTYLFGSLISFIASINFISIFIGSASSNQRVVTFFDSFTAIMFIVLWFSLALLIVMWILTFIQTMFYKNLLRKAQKYG